MRDLIGQLFHWARTKPSAPAFLFLSNSGAVEQQLTFAELRDQTVALAGRLSREAAPGERAALLFAPGLDFIVAFLACLHAGLIAVPMALPRRLATRDATDAILSNARPLLGLTTEAVATALRASRGSRISQVAVTWLQVDRLTRSDVLPATQPVLGEIAFLQYTSGSTSDPKGVVVTHANLSANLAMLQSLFGTTSNSVFASWLPQFHDMGLIAATLHSVAVGATCVLMAPLTFMQRPLRWLRAISDYGVDVAGAPNFAFDHCASRIKLDEAAGLDLSRWRVAFNGAEPVRAATLERFARTFSDSGFAPRAFFPVYGLAEATVLVAGKTDAAEPPLMHSHEGRMIVSCGTAEDGEQIAIVDPALGKRCPAGTTGEIWVLGPNISPGYWCNAEASAASFGAQLDGDAGNWLRTGDLGFLDEAGELFITGRLKDLLIIRGENQYPQDLENSAADCHPALHRQMGAAFTIADQDEEPRLVIVQEVDRKWRGNASISILEAAIRDALVQDHGVAAHRIAIVAPGIIPRTTSGKVQRSRARELWRQGMFATLQ